ncbi:MAG: hypothetical protein RL577_638 [Bacteroidota bacterium]
MQLLGIPIPALVLGVWFLSLELGAQTESKFLIPWLQGVVGSVLLVYSLDFSRDAYRRKQMGAIVPDSWFWFASAWGMVGLMLILLALGRLGFADSVYTFQLGWPVGLVLLVYAYLRHTQHAWSSLGSPILMLLGIAGTMLVPLLHSTQSLWGFYFACLLLVWLNVFAFAYLELDKDQRMKEPNPWAVEKTNAAMLFVAIALVLAIAWKAGSSLGLSNWGMSITVLGYLSVFIRPSWFRPMRWYRFGLDLLLLLPLFF